MEGEKPEAQNLTGTAVQSSKVERRTQTREEHGTPAVVQHGPRLPPPSSCSHGSSPTQPSSAVSALHCKFEEMSQRKCKGKEKPDQFLKVPLEQSAQKHVDKGQPSASQVLPMGQRKKTITTDDKGPEPLFHVHTFLTGTQKETCDKQRGEDSSLWVASLLHGLGERSRLENVAGGTASSLPPKPTSLPRHWEPPRDFWRLTWPECLVLNSQGAPSPFTVLENMTHTCEGELWRRTKPKVGGVEVHKELQRSNCSEGAFYRRCQREASPAETLDQLWRADGWKTVGAIEPKMEKVEIDQKNAEKCKNTAAKSTEVCQDPEHIYRGLPPSYKEADWEPAVSTYGPDLTLSPAARPADPDLSWRHERAKRLLERARWKARARDPDSVHATRSADPLELLPKNDWPAAHRPHPQEQLAPPSFRLLEIGGRTNVHVEFMQRHSRSPAHVHFEDESDKEEEQRHLDQANKRGPAVACRSKVSQQPKADALDVLQASRGFGAVVAGVGIPAATLINDGQGATLQESFRRCGTCGSIVAAGPAKESSSGDGFVGARGQGNAAPPWITPGHVLGGVMLTGGCSLSGGMDATGVGVAGERASAFGKLRRRSRKGDNRVETSHGPYIRRQELLAQRRNSRTRSGLEDIVGPLSKQTEAPVHVTFDLDTSQEPRTARNSPGLQLPIKSALKNRQAGQHGVMQIRGSHLPSPLKFSSPPLTPEPQAVAIREAVDPVDAREEGCSSAPRAPVTRGVAMSKAEDLRAELLRAEHRKAELQWEDKRSEGKPRLSLRRFFSAMGLNSVGKLVKGARSSSMEHLCSSPSRHGSASPSHTPSSSASQGPLQRTPSLQHLHTGSSLAQLRKATSVQSLPSPKRKLEHSAVPGELPLPLGLGPKENESEEGTEALAGTHGAGPVGRLVQVLPDGTLLIELTRTANRPFGFVISRGKGRLDPGIYVEHVGGSATDNIYTGLLGVGDEILEVNGEKVAGMSLDLVTRVMTRENTATIRTVPHRWVQH
ncbi:uncharacterized protein LOC143475758 isoform X2 [Brachyhypopomus gauderio]|uniref:uncharacterized protein LOC143475758 isoform X2 n=1 Tax=Brachyhypopomus gauderio TaxID=698409 RepID=UPI004042B883